VNHFLDVENRVVLDIIPAALVDEEAEPPAAASLQPAGDATQPGSPPPQIPPENGQPPVPSQQPAEASKQTDTGSGPLHP
jgi:hypothetical protein